MNQQYQQKKSNRLGLSERERIIRSRKESGGIAPKRLTEYEIELKKQLNTADSRGLKLETDLEASRAAELSLGEELGALKESVKAQERGVQSERDKLVHERRSIEAERDANVKSRGDAMRFKKEIENTFKPGLKKQAELIEREQQKRRDEVNKHLETKAKLESTKSKLKSATEKYRGMVDASDPRNIEVAHMTKEEVEELRKKLTKHMRTLNGNGGK